MKKILVMFVILSITFCISNSINAVESNNTIKVQQNGEYIDFTDSEGNVVEPQIINNRTMVPFRKIFNSLGINDDNIFWDGESKTVKATKDEVEIVLQINNTVARKIVSGEVSEIILDSSPVIVEGRTLVPIRFIAESMQRRVGWDETNRTVIIIDTEAIKEDLRKSIPNFLEIQNLESTSQGTNQVEMSISGKAVYKDTKMKSNSSTININGNVISKMNSDLFSSDVNLNLSGKGEVYEALKRNNQTKINSNLIVGKDGVYIKSSQFNSKSEGKWVAYTVSHYFDFYQSWVLHEKDFLSSIFDNERIELNINTYNAMQIDASILKDVFSDDCVTIKKKGSTYTYKIEMNLKNIKKAIEKAGVQVNSIDEDCFFEATTTMKNGYVQSIESKISYKFNNETETLEINLESDGKVKEVNTKITLPSEHETIDADDIENFSLANYFTL